MKIFSDGFPESAIAPTRARMVARTFRRGDTIVQQGDPSANVYLIDSGHVAVKYGTENGLTVTLTVLGPTDSFGDLAGLADDESRTASVIALDAVGCRIIAARDFAQLRQENPEINRHLVRVLAHRVLDLNERLSQNLYETVQRRCARRLIDMALMFREAGPESGSDTASIPLTQEDLSGLAAATRPSVNQALAVLSEQGIISLGRGRIEVLSVRALRAYVR